MEMRPATLFGSFAVAAACVGCMQGDPARPEPPPVGSATLRGTVLDHASKAPLAGATVVVEKGGLYLPITDYGAANPAYTFGGVADANGHFEITVAAGVSGVHAFANDHYYRGVSFDSSSAADVSVMLEGHGGQLAKPRISGVTMTPSPATAGARVTLRAEIAAGDATDPLSDEVIVIEPSTGFGAGLTPPSAGSDRDHYPDGTYTASFRAPDKPGMYTYYLSATTGGCVVADGVSVMLSVQ